MVLFSIYKYYATTINTQLVASHSMIPSYTLSTRWPIKGRDRELAGIELVVTLSSCIIGRMVKLYQYLALCLLATFGEAAGRVGFNSELLEEWEQWKTQYRKGYGHWVEELERHLIWASNRKYIEEHNANAEAFGYTLAMNHFGDLVRCQQAFF